MTPAEAIQKDEVYALSSKIRKNRFVGNNEVCLPADSLVRYLLDSSDYKGRRCATDPIWSTKIFSIESITVVNGQPVIYRLSNGPKKYLSVKNYYLYHLILCYHLPISYINLNLLIALK
jgi:hypothetical protein